MTRIHDTRRLATVRAHAPLPIDLDDPAVLGRARRPPTRARPPARARRGRGRAALALGARAPRRASTPTTCAAGGSPRRAGWRSPTRQLAPVERVERPVGVFLAPGARRRLAARRPTLLAGRDPRCSPRSAPTIDRDLRAATLPVDAIAELLERWNPRTLHAGPREHVDSASALADALTRELGRRVAPGAPERPARPLGPRARAPPQPHRRRRHASAPSSACASSPSPAGASRAAGSGRRRFDELPRHPQRGRWNSAKPSRPRSSTACRCCCPPRPPASSRTPSASGA